MTSWWISSTRIANLFLQWESFELDSGKRDALYVPKGCLNAWMTLADETMVHYNMSDFFTRQASRSVRYNDAYFGFAWPNEPAIISQKDLRVIRTLIRPR